MDKELIEHIAAQLHSHEEVYSSGAWERFLIQEEQKKRRFVYWPLWSAAALILIAGGLFFSLDYLKTNDPALLSKSKTKTENSLQTNSANDKKIPKTTIDNQINTNKSLPSIYKTDNSKHLKNLDILSSNINNQSDNLLDHQISNTNLINSGHGNFNIIVQQKKTSNKMSFEELLVQDSFEENDKNASKSAKNTKWQPDVYIAPTIGNDSKINMNYGVSLSYAIANKLSISTGISYAAFSAKEVVNASVPQNLSNRNLESVDANVKGINIPLELKYNISEKLYTGIGVSALAILNNKQQNNYIVNQVQSVSFTNDAGLTDQKNLIVKEQQSELQTEIDPDKYIGFYNFSLGYKQKISPNKNIAIEPFLRVPMKTFSKENLNLTNGGLRLKIDF